MIAFRKSVKKTIVLIMKENPIACYGVGSSGSNAKIVTNILFDMLWMILRTKLKTVKYTINQLCTLS